MEKIKLKFELTNEQRKCLGLAIVEEHWELVKLKDIYLYFDEDIIRKKIHMDGDYYSEYELAEKTGDNRRILLPKTENSKTKKIDYSTAESLKPFGVYFDFSGDSISIANYTTKKSYYCEAFIEEESLGDLKIWLEKWVAETTEKDLKEVEAFKIAERKHFKYKEGDFFAFKVSRNKWGFGRILIDVTKRIKKDKLKENKNYGLTNLMGKPLIVKVYCYISDTIEVDFVELSKKLCMPSHALMDDEFYYGQNVVIGNKPLEIWEQDMLISYSRGIDDSARNIVYLQYGLIFKELKISQFKKYLTFEDKRIMSGFGANPYSNEGVGFVLCTNGLEECIEEKSLRPYWENTYMSTMDDLRNPANIDIKREIFSAFGLDADKNYEENLKLASS